MESDLRAATEFLIKECDETLMTFADEQTHPSYQMSLRKKQLLTTTLDESTIRAMTTLFLLDVWAMCKDVIGDRWGDGDQHVTDLKELFWKVDGLLRGVGFDTAQPEDS